MPIIKGKIKNYGNILHNEWMFSKTLSTMSHERNELYAQWNSNVKRQPMEMYVRRKK